MQPALSVFGRTCASAVRGGADVPAGLRLCQALPAAAALPRRTPARAARARLRHVRHLHGGGESAPTSTRSVLCSRPFSTAASLS
eukprot:4615964-Pleurochrysis_carterae.AAC.1